MRKKFRYLKIDGGTDVTVGRIGSIQTRKSLDKSINTSS